MINKNTQKNTNVSTGTKTESSVYLKKSDLSSELVGKSISSFKNDMGYISASSLDTWLKSHSYLSKSEITTLISNANLVVVDSINKEYDEEAIGRLDKQIRELRGEIVAIKNRLSDMEDDFISIDKESTFATKTSVTNTLKNYAKKEDIPSIDGLAAQSWVEGQGYLTQHQDLSDYLKESNLPSNLVRTSQLDNYVTKAYVKGSLNEYAKKSEIPNVNNFATKSDLNNYAKNYDLNGYAPKKSLNDYAKKTDLSSYAKQNNVYTKDQIDSKDFLTRREARSTYTTLEVTNEFKKEVARDYLKIEDYRGVKDAAVIRIDYIEKSYDDFLADKDKLPDGIYVVNENNIVIKKGDTIIEKGNLDPSYFDYVTRQWIETDFFNNEIKPWVENKDNDVKDWVISQDYASKSWVEEKDNDVKDWVEDQNYASKSWVEEKDNTTRDWVENQDYATNTDLHTKADQSEVNEIKSRLTWKVII